jgi:hypothetical protein
LHWLLTDKSVNPGIDHSLIRDAVRGCADVLATLRDGGQIARSAAWSAAESARSARSAGWSAWSAAESAESAESAAKEHLNKELEKLVKGHLIK